MRTVAMAMCGLALAASGCGGDIQTSDADVQVIQYDALREYLAKGETVMVDVRSPQTYDAGHIPGAINIPFTSFRQRDARLDEAGRIVIYAGGWTDPLSVAGVKRAIALGYGDVYEFKGGVDLWEDSGRTLVKTTPAAPGRPEAGQ